MAMLRKDREAIIDDLEKKGWGNHFAAEDWSPGNICLSTEHWTQEKKKVGIFYNDCNIDPLYGDFGVNKEIETIADKHGCFCEWQNPAVLVIHKL